MRNIERNDAIKTPQYGLNIVVKATPKAILITPKNKSLGPEAVTPIWIPRSIIDIENTSSAVGLLPHNPSGHVYYCDLPQWFVEQNQI